MKKYGNMCIDFIIVVYIIFIAFIQFFQFVMVSIFTKYYIYEVDPYMLTFEFVFSLVMIPAIIIRILKYFSERSDLHDLNTFYKNKLESYHLI